MQIIYKKKKVGTAEIISFRNKEIFFMITDINLLIKFIIDILLHIIYSACQIIYKNKRLTKVYLCDIK